MSTSQDYSKNCTHHDLINAAYCRSKNIFNITSNTCPQENINQTCYISTYSEPIGHSKDHCYEAFYTMCKVNNVLHHVLNSGCTIYENSFTDWCTCEDITKGKNGQATSDPTANKGVRDCICFPYHVNPYFVYKRDKMKHEKCACTNIFRKKCQLFDEKGQRRYNFTCTVTNDELPLERHLNCDHLSSHLNRTPNVTKEVLHKINGKWELYNGTRDGFMTITKNVSLQDFNDTLSNSTDKQFALLEFDLDALIEHHSKANLSENTTHILPFQDIVHIPRFDNKTYNVSSHNRTYYYEHAEFAQGTFADRRVIAPSTHAEGSHAHQHGGAIIPAKQASDSNMIAHHFTTYAPYGLAALLVSVSLALLFFVVRSYKSKKGREHEQFENENDIDPDVAQETKWEEILFDDSDDHNDGTADMSKETVTYKQEKDSYVPKNSQKSKPKKSSLPKKKNNPRSNTILFKKNKGDTVVLIDNEDPE